MSHVPVEAFRGVTRYQTLVGAILAVFPPCHTKPMQSWRFQRAILPLSVRFPCKYSFFELRSNFATNSYIFECSLNSKAYTKELNNNSFSILQFDYLDNLDKYRLAKLLLGETVTLACQNNVELYSTLVVVSTRSGHKLYIVL